jgi:hypothetical protein
LREEQKDAILADVFEQNHRVRVREFHTWLERRAREDDNLGEMLRAADRPGRSAKNGNPDARA